jgi:hypothetical protein
VLPLTFTIEEFQRLKPQSISSRRKSALGRESCKIRCADLGQVYEDPPNFMIPGIDAHSRAGRKRKKAATLVTL